MDTFYDTGEAEVLMTVVTDNFSDVYVCSNVVLLLVCLYLFRLNRTKNTKIANLKNKYFDTTTDLNKEIEDLENKIKDFTVEKYRCFDNVIDLYKRNDDLRSENSKLNNKLKDAEHANERLRSLRQRRSVKNEQEDFYNNLKRTKVF